jgi:hypothetical protein
MLSMRTPGAELVCGSWGQLTVGRQLVGGVLGRPRLALSAALDKVARLLTKSVSTLSGQWMPPYTPQLIALQDVCQVRAVNSIPLRSRCCCVEDQVSPVGDGGAGRSAALCRRWERKWERRSVASCGQTRSDALIVALPKRSDVQQRHQPVVL